jgi:hypothetical protein
VSNNGGYANVYIDNFVTPVATNVTTYNASTIYQQVIWSATGLSAGSHTIEIKALGTAGGHPSGSTDYYTQVDAFIYGTPTLVTSAPHIVLTDTGCSNNETVPPTSVPTVNRGALTNPAEPYGTFTVCADNGSIFNTATVANTNFAAGNPVSIFLNVGGSSGTCT